VFIFICKIRESERINVSGCLVKNGWSLVNKIEMHILYHCQIARMNILTCLFFYISNFKNKIM